MTSAGEHIASELPRPRLSGHIRQWCHPTLTAQWLDHVAMHREGGLGTLEQRRGKFIYLSILYIRKTASTDIVARARRLRELARSSPVTSFRNDFQVGSWVTATTKLPNPNSSFSSDLGLLILKIPFSNKNIILKYF